MPGVPDVYQGSELWEQSLVDPDNRRFVDFDARADLLDSLDRGAAVSLTEKPDDLGAAKLAVTRAALTLRRDQPGAVHDLRARRRVRDSGRPRAGIRPGRGGHGGHPAPGRARGWRRLGCDRPGAAGGTWRDVITGAVATSSEDHGLRLNEVLRSLPVALLVREDAVTPRPVRRVGPDPDHELVRLSVGDAIVEMTRGEGDWWTPAGPVPDPSTVEVDYGYLIDDSDTPVPDPRSRRQPAGVHARSRTYEPRSFTWTDDDWTGRQLAGSVIYELHIGTFTPEGTFDAALGKLDHLRGLGVDFVEVMPVNAVNGIHNWGYDGVLWSAVHEPYGGPCGYQRFVDGCHAAGLGVIQDVVYNHLGPSGNYLPQFGPYLTARARAPGVSW